MTYNTKTTAVIGAGISGLAVARMLKDEGHSVVVFETSRTIGGLVSCSVEKGNLYHRVGGHVFNSKIPAVLDWFWSHFDRDREFRKTQRNASIFLNGRFVPYPIELNIKHLDNGVAERIVAELVKLSNNSDIDGDEQSFGHFLVNNFGETLADIYFLPYNNKIWKEDLFQMSLSWLRDKLPMISPLDIIRSNILSSSDTMVHSQFYYPVRGGSQFIAERLGAGLTIINEEVVTIQRAGNVYHINGQDDLVYDNIVYTGDLRMLPDIVSGSILDSACINNDQLDRVRNLKSHGTTTLLCECDVNPYSWLYLPDSSTKLHRMIMTGNFSSDNNNSSIPEKRITCTVEYTGFMDQQEMTQELSRLPFNPTYIAYHHSPSSYVVHNSDTASAVNNLINIMESIGIYCCGRFAEWEYYNMDNAIFSAMRTKEQIKERVLDR